MYSSVHWTSHFNKVPEQHGHIYLVGLYDTYLERYRQQNVSSALFDLKAATPPPQQLSSYYFLLYILYRERYSM